MGLRTPLYEQHLALGARLVPFGGWDMPLHYGSQIAEHNAVRQAAGMFDVSHMQVVDVTGAAAKPFLRHLLANDVARLTLPGKALYSCMLDDGGGVLDDLIVYYLTEERYRIVVNAATAEKDLAWMERQSAGTEVSPRPRRDLAMIAVQGPEARARVEAQLPEALRAPARALDPFFAAEAGDWFVARTGYTGEDGYEVMLPAGEAPAFWQALLDAGVAPCGLGARDTLRLEAGMNLYGSDMDESTTPLESGLGWTVAWDPEERDFVGRRALEAGRDDPRTRRFVGLVLTGPGVIRGHQRVLSGERVVGETTSGGFAPTLGRSIAFARVTPDIGEQLAVEIRGKPVDARVVKPPFVRRGKPCVEL